MPTIERPAIPFVPMSTDLDRIRFFGTLRPAILLLKSSPWQFLRDQVAGWLVPRLEVVDFIAAQADDAARVGDRWVFGPRWSARDFDPFAFARAKLFLKRARRLVERAGYAADPLDPLDCREMEADDARPQIQVRNHFRDRRSPCS